MHEVTQVNGAGRILIVDDDDDMRGLLVHACQVAHYAVGEAGTGGEAIQRLDAEPFDVLVLDLVLPDMDGVDVLKEIAWSHPDLIKIILTGNPTQDSAIAAVRTGASDYIRKPAGVRDVLSAIGENLAERAQRQRRFLELGLIGREIIRTEDREQKATLTRTASAERRKKARLQLDQNVQEARFVGEETRRVPLTKGETAILAAFLRKPGTTLSHQDLVYEAWGDRLDQDHAASIVRPLIFRLRQKLETEPAMPKLIRTARGVGYVFNPL